MQRIVRDVALPVCEAVLAHRRGDHARAVALMRPVLGDMHQLGGSHAQQDVLMQLFLDSAVKADCADDVRLILESCEARGFRTERAAGLRAGRAAVRALKEIERWP